MKRPKQSLAILLFLFFIYLGCASSQQFVKNPDRLRQVQNVSVINFECDDISVGRGIADGISSQLLMSRFNVIERAKFQKILDEQRLSLSDFLLERESLISKIKGVDAIIVGNATLDYGFAGIANGGYRFYISSATARMIDVETGEVLLASTYRASGPSTMSGISTPVDVGKRLAKSIISVK